MPVITFSRFYPKGHPKAGQPTHFVEKIWMGYLDIGSPMYPYWMKGDKLNIDIRDCYDFEPKHHTIRANRKDGKLWKPGDTFSPRIWSGQPYGSKQVAIAPDIEVKKVWDYETDFNGVPSINGLYLPEKIGDMDAWELLAKNDGLTLDDFISWFRIHPKKNKDDWSFKGQIICWNETIEY